MSRVNSDPKPISSLPNEQYELVMRDNGKMDQLHRIPSDKQMYDRANLIKQHVPKPLRNIKYFKNLIKNRDTEFAYMTEYSSGISDLFYKIRSSQGKSKIKVREQILNHIVSFIKRKIENNVDAQQTDDHKRFDLKVESNIPLFKKIAYTATALKIP